MRMEDWSDPRLIRYAQATGDVRRVYSILCEKYYGRCLTEARRYLGEADAQDLTQQTFVCLGEKIPTLKAPCNVWAYLRKTVRHRAFNHRKREKRFELRDPLQFDSIEAGSNGCGDSRAVTGGEMEEIWRLLDSCLTRREFRVFSLLFRDWMSVTEVSVIECVKEDTIRGRVHAARKKMKNSKVFSNASGFSNVHKGKGP